jgi:hypothetical protein
MNKLAPIICALILLVGSSICMADANIPNLVGTWTVKAEGGVVVKGAEQGPGTHHKGLFSTLTAEAVITEQQGRVMHGTFKSPRASEKFIAVIGHDNKTFHYADQDGFIDGRIIDKDTIEIVYRHVTAADTVAAVGVWTRKK